MSNEILDVDEHTRVWIKGDISGCSTTGIRELVSGGAFVKFSRSCFLFFRL